MDIIVPLCRGVSMYRTRDLVDLAQKGIPEKYRVEIWMVYTGMSKVGKGCSLDAYK